MSTMADGQGSKEDKQKSRPLKNRQSSEGDDSAKLRRKLKEVDRVVGQKTELLVAKQLSYLEYMEVQEEIERLKEFKNHLERKLPDSKPD